MEEEVVDSECAGPSWQKWYAVVKLSWGRVNRRKLPSASLGQPRIGYSPHALPSCPFHPLFFSMSSDVVLPGQPVPVPRGPIPQIGSGIYSRDGAVRASLIGVPSYSGSVGLFVYLFLAGSEHLLNSGLSVPLRQWNV